MKQSTKPMLAVAFDWNINYPCMCQPKYDGVRCLCIVGDDNNVHLLSRSGKEYNVPHLLKWAEEHRYMLPLDGEIYCHKEMTFQQICSAVKCYSPLTEKLKYVVYDRPVEGRMDERIGALQLMFVKITDSPFYLSPWYIFDRREEIEWYHAKCVNEGYEGIIVRSLDGKYTEGRSNALMKYKKYDTNEFEVVDVIEAAGEDEGTGIFKLKVDDMYFHARPIGTRKMRSMYLVDKDSIIGKMCTVQHQGYTDGGIPRFPIALTIRDYE